MIYGLNDMKIDKKYLIFARYMRQKLNYNVRLNKQLLGEDKNVPPLVYDGVMSDLVIRTEPFFMSEKLYGIEPNKAITLEMEKLMENKKKYGKFVYFYRTNWGAQSRAFGGYTVDVKENKSIYVLTLDDIKKEIQKGAPEHSRKNKSGEIISLVFNSDNFLKLS